MSDVSKYLIDSFRKTLYNPEIMLLSTDAAKDLGHKVTDMNFDIEEEYLYLVECLKEGSVEFSIVVDGKLIIQSVYKCGEKLSGAEGLSLSDILTSAGYDLRYLDLESLLYEEYYDESADEFVYMSDDSIAFDRLDLYEVYKALSDDSERLSIAIRRYEEQESDYEKWCREVCEDAFDSDYDDEEFEYLADESEEVFDDEEVFEFPDRESTFSPPMLDMKYYIEVCSENGKEYFSEELPAYSYLDEDEDEARIDNILDLQTLLFRQLRAMRKFGFAPTDEQLERLIRDASDGRAAVIYVSKK